MKNILTFLLTSFLIFNASSQTNTLLFVSAEKCYLEASTNLIIHEKDTFFELSIKKGIYTHNNAHKTLFQYIAPDSAKDGKYILFYKKNKVAVKLNYKKNVLNGPQIEYYYHGDLKSEKFFKNGNFHGSQYFYHLNHNKIRKIENYKNGLKHGLFISFFYEGHPSYIEFYRNGKVKKKKYRWGQSGKYYNYQRKK
tara:strand:- start:47 stop:631 length:585 start_codon:yes stop_codon:yes gene_type:complete